MEIAVVIPALDEADRIEDAIRTLRRSGSSGSRAERACASARAGSIEIIVVDGGSADDTVERARRAGARVLHAARGRARQLEAGWRATGAEVVLFLHADTRLEDDWSMQICSALADPETVGGAFRLRFDRDGWAFRSIAAAAALRVRLFGLPYGDQGIFVRRRTLESVGGIRDVPLMEDLDLVAAMKVHGRVVALPASATTSTRRYAERGVLRTLAGHSVALVAWRLGVERTRIARWIDR